MELEKDVLDLIKEVKTSNVKQEGSFKSWEGKEVDYYVINSDELTLRFWNSSNYASPTNVSHLLDDIRKELLDGELGGELHDGWNNIMWEVI